MTPVLNPDQPLLQTEAFTTFCEGLDHPEGLAFDNERNLWAAGELGQIYRINHDGNVAFGGSHFDDLYVANLGRWHIGRVHLSTPGQRFVNM